MAFCLIGRPNLPWQCVPASDGEDAVRSAHPGAETYKIITIAFPGVLSKEAVQAACDLAAKAASAIEVHEQVSASRRYASPIGH